MDSLTDYLRAIDTEPTQSNRYKQVYMGNVANLTPGDTDYEQFDGLKTSGLSSCIGVVMITEFQGKPLFVLGHLTPSQGFSTLNENLPILPEERWNEKSEFYQIIPGQYVLHGKNKVLSENFESLNDSINKYFPGFKNLPRHFITQNVLRGHESVSLKVLKNGQIIVTGE